MSRSVIRLIQRLSCCLAVVLVVGLYQIASAEPMLMCSFANCFDAGQNRQGADWSGDDSALAASGSLGNFRRIAITPVEFEKGARGTSVLSSIEPLTVNVTPTATISDSNGKFSLLTILTPSKTVSAAGAGTSVAIQGVIPVPEPASMVLLGTGLVGAALKTRKRRQ